MINTDIFKREVLGIAPQMVQNFEELKQQAFQNQSLGIEQDQGHQAQQRLQNMVHQEREREKAEERQGQTS